MLRSNGELRLSHRRFGRIAAVVAGALLTIGCYSKGGLNHSPLPGHAVIVQPDVRLASSADSEPAASAPSVTGPGGPTTRPASPQTRPAPKRTYTAPGAHVRGMSFLTVATASTAVGATLGGGKEAAESRVSPTALNSTGPVTGIASLGAPQPRTVNAIVGQPGLQQGPAIGLGLVGPHNLFIRQINLLSGPGGRCGELVTAGFFANVSACQAQFKRR